MRIWKKFIECECGDEGIMVSHEDYTDNGRLPIIYLSFFRRVKFSRPLAYKLKLAWEALITGEPYPDTVILNKNTAKELANELKLFLASGEPNEGITKRTEQVEEGFKESS